MYCIYCGYKVEDNSNFCVKCGKQIAKTKINIFKKYIKTYNTNLAEQLFRTLIVGNEVDKSYKYQVNKILKKCTIKNNDYPDRQQVLLYIINLIGEPQNSRERYIIARAYAWSRVKYRKNAIYYLELYLNNDLYKEAYIHNHHYHNSTLDDEKKYHLNKMYNYLAKAYEGEYKLEKSLDIYEKMIKMLPDYPVAYRGKCDILIKQNKKENCYNWLLSIKKSKYYKIYYRTTVDGNKIKDDWFKKTIDELLNNTKDKINNNYKYKPKK